jgi:hypothetical protein
MDAAVIQEKLDRVEAQNVDMMLHYRQQEQMVQQLYNEKMKLVSY